MFGDVPVEIAGFRVGEAAREGGLADLPGAGDEHHLARQILCNLGTEVTGQRSHEEVDTVIFDLCPRSSRSNSTWDRGWRPGPFTFQIVFRIVFQIAGKTGQIGSVRGRMAKNPAGTHVAAPQ